MGFKKIFIIFLVTLLFSVTYSFSQNTAYPVNGDNITTFLKRHNRAGKDYVKEFININKNKLGKENQLRLGIAYKIPALSAQVNKNKVNENKTVNKAKSRQPTSSSIFGSKYSKLEKRSNRLKGACFYIVSGHGGPDPGAIAKVGNKILSEDEYAYDFGLRLAKNLMEEGADVYVIIQDPKDGIRDDEYLNNSKNENCMGVTIPLNQVARLKQRVNTINDIHIANKKIYKHERAIFIHVDSRNLSKKIDVFFYHSSNKKSLNMAKTMRSVFQRKYSTHQPGRGFEGTVGKRNLYVINNTIPPSIFVELGNIQNAFDRQRIIINNNRQAVANWMCEAFIIDYDANNKKK